MSGEVENALGIESHPTSDPRREAPKANAALYRVRRGETEQGPYTLRQVRAMWDAGGVTADAEFSDSEGANWRPLLQLMEGTGPGATGTETPTGAAIATLAIQQRLKSTTAAVLLGLFLPFLGAFYGSAMAAIVPLVAAVPVSFILTMIAAQARGSMPDSLAVVYLVSFSSVFAVWSLFWSLRAVRHHNAAVLGEAQRNQ